MQSVLHKFTWLGMLAVLVFRFFSLDKDLTYLEASWIIFWSFFIIYCQRKIFPAKDKNKLYTQGPSAIVRHPIYHGFLFIDLGHLVHIDVTSFVTSPSWIIFLVLFVSCCFFEEKELKKSLGTVVTEYYSQVPRFFFEWIWFRKS